MSICFGPGDGYRLITTQVTEETPYGTPRKKAKVITERRTSVITKATHPSRISKIFEHTIAKNLALL